MAECPEHGPSCTYWEDLRIKPRRLDVSFWTYHVPVRFERTADGFRTFYFGFGKVAWR